LNPWTSIVTFKTIAICGAIAFALACWLRLPAPDRFFVRVGALLVVIAFAEIIGGVLSIMHMKNNFIYNLSWPLEFLLLMGIAKEELAVRRKMVPGLAILFGLVWTAEVVHHGLIERLAALSVMSGAVILTVVYALLLWEHVNTWNGQLRKSSRFWFYLAVVVYFSACTPLLGSINYLSGTDRSLASKLYWLLQAVCILHYLLIGRACLVERRNAA
jgi:hypothetical protein